MADPVGRAVLPGPGAVLSVPRSVSSSNTGWGLHTRRSMAYNLASFGMKLPQLERRYLATFRVSQISHRFTDVLVIGSGVAGSSAAIAAASVPGVEVLLLAKTTLEESSTYYA